MLCLQSHYCISNVVYVLFQIKSTHLKGVIGACDNYPRVTEVMLVVLGVLTVINLVCYLPPAIWLKERMYEFQFRSQLAKATATMHQAASMAQEIRLANEQLQEMSEPRSARALPEEPDYAVPVFRIF